ncbi:hypothetical protein E8E11_008534 [Didymella keratinophila]|nr:hypothetical protein E8E11_008534 [Didymella keratinophila]
METLAAQPFFQRPSTPPMSVQSQASESPTKTPIPDWARKLEDLFEKKPSKEVATQSVPLDLEPLLYSAPAAPGPSVSTPPHRRKQQTSKTSVIPVATPEARINSLDISSDPQDKVQPKTPSTALPPSSPSHLHNVSAATDPDVPSLVEVSSLDSIAKYAKVETKMAVQKRLLDSFIPNKPTTPSDDHERYLKFKLINTMEADMDMPQRTTRRDIKTMNDAELDAHFTKTKGIHKITCEVQQRKDNIGEMNVEALLAAFQLEEVQRFNRSNGSPKAK